MSFSQLINPTSCDVSVTHFPLDAGLSATLHRVACDNNTVTTIYADKSVAISTFPLAEDWIARCMADTDILRALPVEQMSDRAEQTFLAKHIEEVVQRGLDDWADDYGIRPCPLAADRPVPQFMWVWKAVAYVVRQEMDRRQDDRDNASPYVPVETWEG